MLKDKKVPTIKKDRNLSKLLSDLKEDYLRTFPKKMAFINELTEVEDWKNLLVEYHKLKGTGKTYGVPEVSEVCEILEELCSHPSSQKKQLFIDANLFLEELYLAASKNAKINVKTHPIGKTLLRTRPKK